MSQLARPWPPPGDDDERCSQPANTRVKPGCTEALERCGGCYAQRRTGCPAPAVECALQVPAVKCAAGFALVLHALSCTLWLVLTVLSCRALQHYSTIMQPACTTLARTHCRTGCCQQAGSSLLAVHAQARSCKLELPSVVVGCSCAITNGPAGRSIQCSAVLTHSSPATAGARALNVVRMLIQCPTQACGNLLSPKLSQLTESARTACDNSSAVRPQASRRHVMQASNEALWRALPPLLPQLLPEGDCEQGWPLASAAQHCD